MMQLPSAAPSPERELRVIRGTVREILSLFDQINGQPVELPSAQPLLDDQRISVLAHGVANDVVFRCIAVGAGLRVKQESDRVTVEPDPMLGRGGQRLLVEPKIELPPGAEPQLEQQIREKLQQKISFDFVDTPFEDVMQFLRHLTNVAIIIDPRAIDKLERNTVTLKVNEMKLEAALGWICRLVDLDYSIRNGAIFVTRGAGPGASRTMPRVYDLQDILFRPRDFPGLVFAENPSASPKAPGELGKLVSGLVGLPPENRPLLDSDWLVVPGDEAAQQQVEELLGQFGAFTAVKEFRCRAKQPVCLMLQKVSAADAMGFLKEATGLNVVYDAGLDERVRRAEIDLELAGTPAWGAMLHCCRLAGLACRVEGDLAVHVLEPQKLAR
jgi:hypothetical protein